MITDAQRAMLIAVRDFADDNTGWAEVELQFLSMRTSDRYSQYLEASICKRVGDALRKKGLLNSDGSPQLTNAGRAIVGSQ